MTTAQKVREQKAVLKGVRKAEVTSTTQAHQAVKPETADSKARAKFKDDVEYSNPRYSTKSLEQRAEFQNWVHAEFRKANEQGRRLSDFFTSMLTKLIGGDELSDNMVSALRKCKDRDIPKPVDGASQQPSTVVTITLKIRKFLQTQMKLDSRLITGVVKQESYKAYLIEGHADMLKEQSWCMRCGQPLTQPASYTIGFGAICADHMGLPYPDALNSLTGKERAEYRKSILGVLHKQKFERWIPKSQVDEIITRKEEAPKATKRG